MQDSESNRVTSSSGEQAISAPDLPNGRASKQ
jgi:hypothetical protein